jgi:LDH2 family malate/lactate/ureidoglycolate dehydrogenase
MSVIVEERLLREFVAGVFVKAGLSEQDAETVADSLVFANLKGIDSHGIMRVPFYVKRLVQGGTSPRPQIKILVERPATVSLDGDNGMGPVVGMYACDLAVKKATENGMCMVTARRSSHFGAAAYYAAKIAEADMIGVAISNCTPVMAAWGGAKNVIGNNPLAIATPCLDSRPLIFDIAMSRVAGGKVRLAAKNEKKIPKGWILDRFGQPTDNPDDLPNGGALLPFGEHKGFGLAIMLEVLSGALAGSGMLEQIPFWQHDLTNELNIGHSFIAIDIAGFMDLQLFRERVAWIVKTLKSSPVAPGYEGIRMPGEIEFAIEEERKKEGIPVSDEVMRDLELLAESYQVPLKTGQPTAPRPN